MFDLAVQNLELLNRLDLGETWENTTQEERKDLLHVMLPECSIDVAAKRVIWIEDHPDFNVPFRLRMIVSMKSNLLLSVF